jgi:hypothetical protein
MLRRVRREKFLELPLPNFSSLPLPPPYPRREGVSLTPMGEESKSHAGTAAWASDGVTISPRKGGMEL